MNKISTPKSPFIKRLESQWRKGNYVCVGLDSDLAQIPQIIKDKYKKTADILFNFNKALIDSTHDLVCAYKPNIAYYDDHIGEGLEALKKTIEYIKSKYPEITVIIDAKRADIDSTNLPYTREMFDVLKTDAVTVHPYLGAEALKPFLERQDKGIIVLVRTSNPGAGEFQDLLVGKKPLYQIVAKNIAKNWNKYGNCAVVTGATYPKELAKVRKIIGDIPMLIPGIGKQGGDLEATIKASGDRIIINSSRGIIFASKEADFATRAREETMKLKTAINNLLRLPKGKRSSR